VCSRVRAPRRKRDHNPYPMAFTNKVMLESKSWRETVHRLCMSARADALPSRALVNIDPCSEPACWWLMMSAVSGAHATDNAACMRPDYARAHGVRQATATPSLPGCSCPARQRRLRPLWKPRPLRRPSARARGLRRGPSRRSSRPTRSRRRRRRRRLHAARRRGTRAV
jgi:hypothetical protein